MKAVKNRLRRRQQKNGNPTVSEEKEFKILYTKGPAAFGSVKNLTNASQLSPKKFKIFSDLNHHIQSMDHFVQSHTVSLMRKRKKSAENYMKKNLVQLETKLIITKMGSDEFTVHLISTASMDYFPDNISASFRIFFKEEIALDGDWRVALSKIIFPTKINNVTDEEFT